MESALFPTYARYPRTLIKGKGARVWDDQGKQYLDFAAGLAVTNLGHVPEQVKAAITAQLDQLWHTSNLFHIPNQEKAAKLLTEVSPADCVFFCNSGAEANEAAIKLARRYHQLVAGTGRYEVITFQQSFHGRTLATLTATGQTKIQQGFAPLPVGFQYAVLNDLDSVKALVTDKTAAVMLELVQCEGGVLIADPTFVKELAAYCKEQGLLLIVDEIQTGMGRTGKWFAFQHYGIEPDIFTLAKGLGSGVPVGAMCGKGFLREAFSAGSHGSTFGGTPLIMASVVATLETMAELAAPAKAAAAGELLVKRLQEELKGLAQVKEIRGLGLIIGIECDGPVADKVAALHEAGLLVVTAGPNVIRLLPYLLVSAEEVEEAVATIASVLRVG
ncbi:MAG TPA: acetylornithine transaminase [Symbiobacteriaceae bacterium]|nr:acetylornithine transaminase [Symbiobacteriaceae bacterium]